MPHNHFSNLICKIFARMHRAYREHILRNYIDEAHLLFKAFGRTEAGGVMYDVGAHWGFSLRDFAKAGWRIEAFEPDSKNFDILKAKTVSYRKVNLHPFALGAEDRESVDFYSSFESSGVSGLSPFLDSHQKGEPVPLHTIESFIKQTGSPCPDFLKIDTEGHDLFVLQGYPWELQWPRFVLCEFEDSKTKALGYNFEGLCTFLENKGYSLIISEWHPILSYGSIHRWKGFHANKCEPLNEGAWGNIIAFRQTQDYKRAKTMWQVKDEKH